MKLARLISVGAAAALSCTAVLSWAGVARAADERADHLPAALDGVGFDQHLGAQLPLDVQLVDEAGRPRKLGELLQGRPAILTLNYFQCPMLCNAELDGLVSSLKGVSFAPGTDFDVITVSFDTSDKAEQAQAKKAHYLASYGRAGAENGWHFVTGDDAAIRALTQAVGFRYRWDEASKQFAHAAGIVVLTPDGKASRYFFGVEFPPRDIRLALVESSEGKIGTLVDQVMLFCFHYDPTASRYGFAALTAVRAGGIATIIALVVFVVLGNRRGARPLVPSPMREVTHGV